MSSKWNTSAIVCTYNRSDRLRLCIASLEMQTVLPDEVVIADDGSSEEHVRVIEEIIGKSPLKIVHAWQEDRGFRLAASRNNGVRHASGDYLIFADCDVILSPDCLEIHVAHASPRHWLAGNALWLRADASQEITEEAIRSGRFDEMWPGPKDRRCIKLRARARRFRIRSFMQRLWGSERRFRRLHMKGVHFSMPREAIEKVNGFDEKFEGWGQEDGDIALRLQLAGFRGRTVGDLARVLHLHHERAQKAPANAEYFDRPRHGEFRCRDGLRAAPDGAGTPDGRSDAT